jgi:hypothetical protein
MLLASMSMMNLSPGHRYPRTGAIYNYSFRDQKVTSPSGDHWKALFPSMGLFSIFAVPTNPAVNLWY